MNLSELCLSNLQQWNSNDNSLLDIYFKAVNPPRYPHFALSNECRTRHRSLHNFYDGACAHWNVQLRKFSCLHSPSKVRTNELVVTALGWLACCSLPCVTPVWPYEYSLSTDWSRHTPALVYVHCWNWQITKAAVREVAHYPFLCSYREVKK